MSCLLEFVDTSLDGLEFVVHLKTCIHGVESVQAVVEVCAVGTLSFSIELVDVSDGVVEVRDGLAEERLAFIEEFLVETGLIVRGHIVGLGEFVDGAVVEHLAQAEVGKELVGEFLDGLFVAGLGIGEVVHALVGGTGCGQQIGVEFGFVDGSVKGFLDFLVAFFNVAFI